MIQPLAPIGKESETADTAVWWVIHVRPRCEKKMARWLADAGVETYLPLRRVLRSYPGKRVEFQIPLFPGYVFACFSLRDRNAIYASNWAAHVLPVENQADLLRQLQAVRLLLQSGVSFRDCPYFETGQRVRIHGGELKGLDGVVQRVAGRERLVISVDLLQRSVAVEVDSRWLSAAV